MPDQNTNAEAALQKLGQRLRMGLAKRHPVSDKNLEAVKNTVREQYEQEQTAVRQIKPAPGKSQSKKPPERGFEP